MQAYKPLFAQRLSILVILLAIAASCAEKRKYEVEEANHAQTQIAAAENKDSIVPPPKPIEISYYAITNRDSINNIANYFNDTQLKIILAINRIDIEKLYGAQMLAIPDTFLADIKYYSPFPDSIPLIDSVKKILLISYPAQALAAYEQGKLIKWMPNSMGKQTTPTPTGLLHTNWKAKQTKSTDDSTWILNWYFNLDNFRGVSLHQYELPGRPASHACIRLYNEDAEWVYNWAEQWKLDSAQVKVLAYGTPVIIFGSYNFSQNPPWYSLTTNPKQLTISADTLTAEINKYLPTILKRQADRDSFIYKLTSPTDLVSTTQ